MDNLNFLIPRGSGIQKHHMAEPQFPRGCTLLRYTFQTSVVFCFFLSWRLQFLVHSIGQLSFFDTCSTPAYHIVLAVNLSWGCTCTHQPSDHIDPTALCFCSSAQKLWEQAKFLEGNKHQPPSTLAPKPYTVSFFIFYGVISSLFLPLFFPSSSHAYLIYFYGKNSIAWLAYLPYPASREILTLSAWLVAPCAIIISCLFLSHPCISISPFLFSFPFLKRFSKLFLNGWAENTVHIPQVRTKRCRLSLPMLHVLFF